MQRRRSAAVGTFALALFTPLLVSGGSSAVAVSAATTAAPVASAARTAPADATAGPGKLTSSMRAEIDRVVAAGQTPAARSALRSGPSALADSQVRCADFEGQRYCLNTGWTTETQAAVRREAAGQLTAMRARRAGAETTGDLTPADQLRQRAAMSPAKRAAVERKELTAAAKSVAKVWLLRNQIQGEPLPDGFLQRHPEVTSGGTSVAARTAADSTTDTTATAEAKPASAYPQKDHILNPKNIREQHRTYWCGVSSMQAIGWGWSGERKSQKYWARQLGTTSSGTAISAMVNVTNAQTGYDKKKYAGKYIVLDIGNWSYAQWWKLQMRHITDYHAPVILHPILLKRFYPYLDDDASGHFQVGRGYDKRGSKANSIHYFEPWNQQRFDPSEPYISRTQSRSAYKSYRANQAHSMHNIGV